MKNYEKFPNKNKEVLQKRFLYEVKTAREYIKQKLQAIPGHTLSVTTIDCLIDDTFPIGIFFAGFFVHSGDERVYRKRIMEVDFFPSGIMRVAFYDKQMDTLVKKETHCLPRVKNATVLLSRHIDTALRMFRKNCAKA